MEPEPIERRMKSFRGTNDHDVSRNDFVNHLGDALALGAYPQARRPRVKGLEKLLGRFKQPRTYESNETFWLDALAGRQREGRPVTLRGFHLTEWLPQSPGRYFTKEARQARDKAVASWWSPDRAEFFPAGKLGMILGGVGSVRLRSRKRMYFFGATSNGVIHQGVPLILDEPEYTAVVDAVATDGGCVTTIEGTLTVPPRKLKLVNFTGAVPKYCVYVRSIELERSSRPGELMGTAAVMYPTAHHPYPGTAVGHPTTLKKHWTFCSFDPSLGPPALKKAVDWLIEYAIRYSGAGDAIFSEFDEHCNHFDRPVEFPIGDLVDGHPDYERLGAYARAYDFSLSLTKELIRMDPATAAAFLSGLASVSTIVKNVREWIATDKAPDKKSTLQQADAVGAAVAKDKQSFDAILKISDQIFKPIDGRIKRTRKKLEEVLNDPYTPKERRREVMDQCDEDICEALQDIMRYNGGLLPEPLKPFWDEHGCANKS